MISKLVYSSLLISLCLMTQGCSSQTDQEKEPVQYSQDFKDYWFSGKAEVSSFKLEQARYGQKHDGEAVMIFVTEDFLTKSQVKEEKDSDEASTTVMKLNKIKRFPAGIYDYQMMSSVFSPIQYHEFPHSLKVTTGSQDWCGQSYFQMNHRRDKYRVQGFSYFQDEVHEDYRMEEAWLEDEVWTRIKLDPKSLPTGSVQMVPGTMYKRLRHRKLEPEKAKVSLKEYKGNDFKGNGLNVYSIEYPELERSLKIIFEEAFPHTIQGWEDTYKSGFGEGAKEKTTKAVRKTTLRTDYWNKNNLEDSSWRKKLKLQ